MTALTNCTDFMFKFVAFRQEIYDFYDKRYFLFHNFTSCFIKINILYLNIQKYNTVATVVARSLHSISYICCQHGIFVSTVYSRHICRRVA